ncbi:hypothetical protein GY45DRAFT_711345 [Cubamyces sp. BRFM 1775]|nr:hypothetical protein GY45DRAFT_711345 [Cubamyces sp. BRFM 1775]
MMCITCTVSSGAEDAVSPPHLHSSGRCIPACVVSSVEPMLSVMLNSYSLVIGWQPEPDVHQPCRKCADAAAGIGRGTPNRTSRPESEGCCTTPTSGWHDGRTGGAATAYHWGLAFRLVLHRIGRRNITPSTRFVPWFVRQQFNKESFAFADLRRSKPSFKLQAQSPTPDEELAAGAGRDLLYKEIVSLEVLSTSEDRHAV